MKPKKKASQKPIVIGIDLMGSEISPKLLLNSIVKNFHWKEGISLFFIATEEVFQNEDSALTDMPAASFHTTASYITMDEDPLYAIRRKKDSSLCRGIALLEKGEIDAFVTAGNTGALVASARMMLPLFPLITRPALMALMPTKKNLLSVIDVGANVSCTAHHLLEFAKLGVAFQKSQNITLPRVGLLNIGVEKKKGTSELRQAYQMLTEEGEKKSFSFIGNVEGKEVFQGDVDVLVTEGFTGNIFLKTAEGVASLVLDKLQENILQKEFLYDLQKHLHYAKYPGALLCGVERIIVKCHGYSSDEAFLKALDGAVCFVKENLTASMKQFL